MIVCDQIWPFGTGARAELRERVSCSLEMYGYRWSPGLWSFGGIAATLMVRLSSYPARLPRSSSDHISDRVVLRARRGPRLRQHLMKELLLAIALLSATVLIRNHYINTLVPEPYLVPPPLSTPLPS